jgi:hypothetical protein
VIPASLLFKVLEQNYDAEHSMGIGKSLKDLSQIPYFFKKIT